MTAVVRRRIAAVIMAAMLVGATIMLESCRPDDGGGWRSNISVTY